jgi:hypothetical protein
MYVEIDAERFGGAELSEIILIPCPFTRSG